MIQLVIELDERVKKLEKNLEPVKEIIPADVSENPPADDGGKKKNVV